MSAPPLRGLSTLARPRRLPQTLRPIVGCLVLGLLLAFSRALLAQMDEPFPGSSTPPPAGHTTVNSSIFLERILGMDMDHNTYQAAWWVVFTWYDPAASAAVSTATGAALRGGDCGRWCESSGIALTGCCDGLWLPRVHLLNMVALSQEQISRHRIHANASSGIVTWSARLVGTWYSPFDSRAYPFEHQHLLLELGLSDAQAHTASLRWEQVAKLNNTPHTKGADLAGWRMKWGKGKLYDSRACMTHLSTFRYELATDAAADPSAPAAYVETPSALLNYTEGHLAGASTPESCGSYTSVYAEAQALFPAVVLVGDIMLKRIASYYVLANLFPVLLVTLITFTVFFMPITALGDRMMVVLTMFLSLTALQFVFAYPPANYINALGQVVLVSYAMIALACAECLVVNQLATVAHVVTTKRSCEAKYGEVLRGRSSTRRLRTQISQQAPRGGTYRREDSDLTGMPIPEEHVSLDLPAPSASCPVQLPRTASRSGASQARPGPAPAPKSLSSFYAQPSPTPSSSAPASLVEISLDTKLNPAPSSNGLGHLAPPQTLPPNPFRKSSDGTSAVDQASTLHASSIDLKGMAAAIGGPGPDPSRGCCFPGAWAGCSPAADGAAGAADAGPLRRCCCAVGEWFAEAAARVAWFYRQCKEDPEFAHFLAARIDKWSLIFCLLSYTVAVTVVLVLQTMVGDHKLMLSSDRPGNM
ncbi:hypothetical protein HYH03_007613 [Edaphochlamys debaryana]|uniref:Neurotransmitter-gated ion-channel ligand-binding domain-containing protein n=1 Tax=Edaphochlamys debaryana TaxID=47281 RepID=A0A835Y3Y1_9CHLO|nr:hypothetical protein HYH03_007613 [Edaphochlamys debaryana]|eukprot:KAG2494258.1 hypothetical protein HYH03_007613 [Edaphochlamys debaryana]